MIPLVYEHDWKPNIWFPNVTGYKKQDIHRDLKYYRQIPCLLQQCEDLYIFKPSDISSLSSFIYPVIMQEPAFQSQVLIQNNHEDWGLWSYIDKQVIDALRNNKGYILIDITIEPMLDSTLKLILYSLEDCSEFPNNRIILNSFSQTYNKHPKVFSLPSFLETHYGGRIFKDSIYNDNLTDKKIYTMLNMRSEKHAGALLATAILDRNNLLKNGHVSSDIIDLPSAWDKIKFQLAPNSRLHNIQLDSIKNNKDIFNGYISIPTSLKLSLVNIVIEAYYNDYQKFGYPLISEKTWRNVSYKKPFIIVGQKNTLKYFRNLGYKTFHPYIDESYDDLDDDYRVKAAIVQVIKLINFTDSQWYEFLHNITPILEYNISNYSSRVKDIHNLIELLLNNKL